MNKVREILRLRWQLKLTVREAARSLGVSSGVVSETTTRATKAGLTLAEVEGLGEQELERRLYGPVAAVAGSGESDDWPGIEDNPISHAARTPARRPDRRPTCC
jgi:DNA-binding transcriptional ArsR family regulator